VKGLHGLLHRFVSLAIIGSLLLPSYPVFAEEPAPTVVPPTASGEPSKEEAPPIAPAEKIDKKDPEAAPETTPAKEDAAKADETEKPPVAVTPPKINYKAVDKEIIKAKSPRLGNLGKKTNYSTAATIAGESWSDNLYFWPFAGLSTLLMASYYVPRWKNYLKETRGAFEKIKRGGNELEWLTIQANKKKVAEKLEKLLLQANVEDAKRLLEFAPDSTKSSIIADLKARGASEFVKGPATFDVVKDAAGTTTFTAKEGTLLQDILDAFQEYHALNKAEFGILREYGARLERQLGMKPGSQTAKLLNPDKFLEEVSDIASKVPKTAATDAEMARYITEVEQKATSTANTARAVVFGADKNPLHGLPWFTKPFGDPSIAKSLRNRFVRTTAPFLAAVAFTFGAYNGIRFLHERPRQQQKQAEDADLAAKQSEEEGILAELNLAEKGSALVVEFVWRGLQEKYGNQFGGLFKTLPSPASVRDEASFSLVKDSHLVAQAAYLLERKDPGKKGPLDDKAREKVEAEAEKLGVEAPDEDKDLSVLYYRVFWDTLLRKVRQLGGVYEGLSQIPEERDPDVEALAGRVPTWGEILDQLATESPGAMLKAIHYQDNYRSYLADLVKITPKKRARRLAEIRENDADLARELAAGVKTLEAFKEARLSDTEQNPLPLTDEEEAKWKAEQEKRAEEDKKAAEEATPAAPSTTTPAAPAATPATTAPMANPAPAAAKKP